MNNFIEAENLPWSDLGGGLFRQIVGYEENLMQVKVKFKKDAVGVLHRHFHAQCSYIASGRFEVQIKNEKKILVPGDAFYVESNALHGVVCLEEGILIDTFTPARKDFLP